VGLAASVHHPKIFQMGKWLGGLSFLAYVAAGIAFDGYDPLDHLYIYAAEGGALSAIVIGASRLTASVALWTWNIIMVVPRSISAKIATSRRHAAEKVRREQEAFDRAREYQREQQVREQRQRLAEEQERQRQEAARQFAIDERRRMDARAECELCYSRHLKEIAKRFPKPLFDAFMRSYMNSDQPVEAVERRAKELQRIVQFHRDAAKPPKKFYTMRELTTWFMQEKEQLDSLPIDDELREEQLIALNVRYSELAQTMLDKIQP